MIGLIRIGALAGLVLGSRVHPLHTTHTELTVTASGVAISVRAFSDDLTRALLQRERSADDSAKARYIRETLGLKTPSGHPVMLTLTKVEQDGPVTWLHFTAAPTTGLRGWWIHPMMQTELFEDQVNVVRAVANGREQSLLFLRGDGPQALR